MIDDEVLKLKLLKINYLRGPNSNNYEKNDYRASITRSYLYN